MELLANPDIEKVYYQGDHHDERYEMTLERLMEITKHYIARGKRGETWGRAT